jgi:hypothetical protein
MPGSIPGSPTISFRTIWQDRIVAGMAADATCPGSPLVARAGMRPARDPVTAGQQPARYRPPRRMSFFAEGAFELVDQRFGQIGHGRLFLR